MRTKNVPVYDGAGKTLGYIAAPEDAKVLYLAGSGTPLVIPRRGSLSVQRRAADLLSKLGKDCLAKLFGMGAKN